MALLAVDARRCVLKVGEVYVEVVVGRLVVKVCPDFGGLQTVLVLYGLLAFTFKVVEERKMRSV